MSDLKVLYIPTSNSGVAYWRMYNFVNAAVRNKAFYAYLMWWQKSLTETHPWETDIDEDQYRARIVNELEINARQADIVIMQMCHTQSSLSLFLSLRDCFKIPILTEIDDNMVSTADYNPASPFYAPGSIFRQLAISQFRQSDGIIVTTPYLKDIYKEFNDHIYIIPNCIDFERWDKNKKKSIKNKIRIGWVGGASHTDDLMMIEPAIKELTSKYKNIEFMFLHGAPKKFEELKGVKINRKFEKNSLKYSKYVAKSGFDIGIAPLIDNSFNRSKSNLRWLEYGSLGIPCVASNIGHFKETIKHAETGLLCDTSNDFVKNIELLINDKKLRKTIGNNALNAIKQDFNVDKVIFEYKKILTDVKNLGITYKEDDYKSLPKVNKDVNINVIQSDIKIEADL